MRSYDFYFDYLNHAIRSLCVQQFAFVLFQKADLKSRLGEDASSPVAQTTPARLDAEAVELAVRFFVRLHFV